MAQHNTIGYNAIGSGDELARLALIHRNYDKNCSIEEALHSVVEAKVQAEEASGVGTEMDIVVINSDGTPDKFKNSEVKELRDIYEEVSKKVASAREEVLTKREYKYTPPGGGE